MKLKVFILQAVFYLWLPCSLVSQNYKFEPLDAAFIALGIRTPSHPSDFSAIHLNPAAMVFQDSIKFSLFFNPVFMISSNYDRIFGFIDRNRQQILDNFIAPSSDPNYMEELHKRNYDFGLRGIANQWIRVRGKQFGLAVSTIYIQKYTILPQNQLVKLGYQDELDILATLAYSKHIPFHKKTSPLSIGFSFDFMLSKRNQWMIQNEEDFDLYYLSFAPQNIMSNYDKVLNEGSWFSRYSFNASLFYTPVHNQLIFSGVIKNLFGSEEDKLITPFWLISSQYSPFRDLLFVYCTIGNSLSNSDNSSVQGVLGLKIRFHFLQMQTSYQNESTNVGVTLRLGDVQLSYTRGYFPFWGNMAKAIHFFQFSIGE